MITKEQLWEGSTEAQLCLACSKLTTYVSDEEEWHRKRCGIKNRENLSRIHIIGGPGSGKTTLAREIGAHLGIEAHELDQIAFTGRDFEERPFQDRVAAINRIASCPTWITEGLFVRWTDELFARANVIVWLDHVNWERGLWRIARRFVKSAIREVQKRRGLERFTRFPDYVRNIKQLIQVFFSSRAYYSGSLSRSTDRIESRLTTAAFLKPYNEKVIHCYRDESVEAFIEYIHICREQWK
jgi:adenylate kinase family enzyme